MFSSQLALCTDDCNNRGDCNNGTCACDEPWTGPTCDTSQSYSRMLCKNVSEGCVFCCPVVCAKGCETHGTCDNGTCNCDMGWRGVDCLTGKSVENSMVFEIWDCI